LRPLVHASAHSVDNSHTGVATPARDGDAVASDRLNLAEEAKDALMKRFCRRSPRASHTARVCAGAVALTAAIFATGCASNHGNLKAFLRSHEAEVATGHYVVRPPDAIAVHSPTAAEIDGAVQAVRPDGKVVFRLLGEVDVVGLTTEEIAAKLKAQLSRFYVEPEVVVEVQAYRSQYYYVFGEVGAPGPKPFTGRDTLLRALAEAQPTYLAWRAQIRVTRPAAQAADSRTIIVDLDRMLSTGDVGADVLLQEGDVIEVPPTPLAWVGHRIREVMYPVDPVLNAYTRPAEAIQDTHTYEGEFSNTSTDSGSSRRRLER
jgi:protein involved in polysaccharide export with SLBB domain